MNGRNIPTRRLSRRAALTGAVVAALFLLPGAQAHSAGTSDEHGRIEVDMDRSGDPCVATVHLSQLDFQNGSLELNIVLEGTAPDQGLDRRSFNATPEDGGFAATMTGFEMREGWEYYFVVESDPRAHTFASEIIAVDEGDCGDPEDEPCFGVELMATANEDGSITLAAEGLDGEAELWRTSVGASAQQIATLSPDDPTYIDTDTQAGVAYTYSVFVDGAQCERVHVTAIPYFPSLLASGAGLAAMAVAYVAFRRRD